MASLKDETAFKIQGHQIMNILRFADYSISSKEVNLKNFKTAETVEVLFICYLSFLGNA